MQESKPPKTTKPIVVSVEAWEKARKMAGLRKAQDQDGDDMSAIATEAILERWEKLPDTVRALLEQPA